MSESASESMSTVPWRMRRLDVSELVAGIREPVSESSSTVPWRMRRLDVSELVAA